MRLTCPSCSAIYEVDDIAIPASGRRVRCAACDGAWRVSGEGAVVTQTRAANPAIAAQPRSAQEPSRAAAPEAAPEPAPESAPQAAEAADPAPPVEPAPEQPAAAAPNTSPEPEPAADPEPAPAPESAAGTAPEPPEDSTQDPPKPKFTPLRPKQVAPAPEPEVVPEAAARRSPMRSAAGFLIGFAAIMILSSPYLFRAQIVAAAPGAAPVVEAYADTVGKAQDGIRSFVDYVSGEVSYLVGGLSIPEQEAPAPSAEPTAQPSAQTAGQ